MRRKVCSDITILSLLNCPRPRSIASTTVQTRKSLSPRSVPTSPSLSQRHRRSTFGLALVRSFHERRTSPESRSPIHRRTSRLDESAQLPRSRALDSRRIAPCRSPWRLAFVARSCNRRSLAYPAGCRAPSPSAPVLPLCPSPRPRRLGVDSRSRSSQPGPKTREQISLHRMNAVPASDPARDALPTGAGP